MASASKFDFASLLWYLFYNNIIKFNQFNVGKSAILRTGFNRQPGGGAARCGVHHSG